MRAAQKVCPFGLWLRALFRIVCFVWKMTIQCVDQSVIALNHGKNLTIMNDQKIPWFQKLWKQSSRLRSCALCIRGLA